MTEDEAKTKWCPFARDSETAGNRSIIRPDDIRFPCIASACMAWRPSWVDPGPIIERQEAAPGSTRPDGWSYLARDHARASLGGEWVRLEPGVAHGYCGLAGAPQ